jgi:hypothetical protein
MSFAYELAQAAGDIKKLEEIIVEHVSKIDLLIESAEPLFDLDGKRLEQLMRDVQQTYARAAAELKSALEMLETEERRIYAKLYKRYNEGYSRKLSSTDIAAYINGDAEKVEINNLIHIVSFNRNQLLEITEGFKTMTWQLGHITKLRVAEMQDALL